jgi:hypothetical protein
MASSHTHSWQSHSDSSDLHAVINGASYCVERRGLVWVSLFVIVFNVAEWFFELFILTCPQNETRKINSNFFYFILQDFWVNQTVFSFITPLAATVNISLIESWLWSLINRTNWKLENNKRKLSTADFIFF